MKDGRTRQVGVSQAERRDGYLATHSVSIVFASGPLSGSEVDAGAAARDVGRGDGCDVRIDDAVDLAPARRARARLGRLPHPRPRQHQRRAGERRAHGARRAEARRQARARPDRAALRGRGALGRRRRPTRWTKASARSRASVRHMSGNGPRTIGNFSIERELGSGGMGVVLLGRHQSLDRPAVLKRLRPDLSASEDLVERFAREARSAASIHHQNVVAVYDWISWRGEHYIAQEYVDGVDLREALGHAQRFPWRLAALVALELARGLEAIHARGMVHRDLKPANVLLGRNGDVKIADFGIAIDATSDGLTRPGTTIGSPPYIAPEQLLGERVDARGDLFGLGVVLYELLTGAPPYREPGAGRDRQPAHPHPARALRAGAPDRDGHAALAGAAGARARSRQAARAARLGAARAPAARAQAARVPGRRAARAGELALGDRRVPSARGRHRGDLGPAARAGAGGCSGAGVAAAAAVAHRRADRVGRLRVGRDAERRSPSARARPSRRSNGSASAPARLRFEIDQRLRVALRRRRRRRDRARRRSTSSRPADTSSCSSGRAARTPSSSSKPRRAKSSACARTAPTSRGELGEREQPVAVAARVDPLVQDSQRADRILLVDRHEVEPLQRLHREHARLVGVQDVRGHLALHVRGIRAHQPDRHAAAGDERDRERRGESYAPKRSIQPPTTRASRSFTSS